MAVALAHDEVVKLTTNSTLTWETVDVSSDYPDLPSDAAGVMLVFETSGADAVGVRKSGNTNFTQTTALASSFRQAAYAALDASYQIDVYRGASDVDVYLVGYFTTDYEEESPPVDITPGTSGSVQNVDVSSYAPSGAKFAVVEVAGAGNRGTGFAYTGAGAYDGSYSNGHLWALVPLDGSDTFDCIVENGDPTVYLVGFVTAGSVRSTKGTDLFASLSTGSYQTITLPDTGKEIAVIEVISKTANRMFDLAPSTYTSWPAALYEDAYDNAGTDIVKIDGSDQAVAKIENGATEAYCFGYLEDVSSGATALTLAALQHNHTLAEVTPSQLHNLITSALQHSHTLASFSVSEIQTLVELALSSLQHSHALDGITVAEIVVPIALTIEELSHAHGLDSITVGSAVTVIALTISALQHTHNLDSTSVAEIVVPIALTLAEMQHNHALANITLTQFHELLLSNLRHTHELDATSVGESITLIALTVAGLNHPHTLDALSTSVFHVLLVDGLGHSHSISAIGLTQFHKLLVESLQHVHDLATASLNLSIAEGSVTVSLDLLKGTLTIEHLDGSITIEHLDGSITIEEI